MKSGTEPLRSPSMPWLVWILHWGWTWCSAMLTRESQYPKKQIFCRAPWPWLGTSFPFLLKWFNLPVLAWVQRDFVSWHHEHGHSHISRSHKVPVLSLNRKNSRKLLLVSKSLMRGSTGDWLCEITQSKDLYDNQTTTSSYCFIQDDLIGCS